MSVNRMILVGNLGLDPEIRTDQMQMLGSKPAGDGQGRHPYGQAHAKARPRAATARPPAPRPAQQPAMAGGGGGGFDPGDDIAFELAPESRFPV